MKKVKIKYTLKSPLSHIGETASTGSYFQTILTAGGRLPIVTGNSIRGQLRDNMAMHLLDTMSEGETARVDKDTFNLLFSGGNINGTMKEDVQKAKNVREHFPMISLMGGGLGDMIMAGKMLCGCAYPVVKESESITGIHSDISWHSLIDEIEFTRTDDGKNEQLEKYLLDAAEEKTAKASTQMRFAVQYMAAGTEFVQDILFLDSITDLELGAFYAGLLQWWKVPRLGGMAAKGFGFFDAEMEGIAVRNGEITASSEIRSLVNAYEDFVRGEGMQYLPLLSAKKEKKNGKATNKPD